MAYNSPRTDCGFLKNYWGTLSGTQLRGSINVCVTQGGNSSSEIGSFTATVSPDGNSISGSWTSTHGSGSIGETRLHKIASKKAILNTVKNELTERYRDLYPMAQSVKLKGKVVKTVPWDAPASYDPAGDAKPGKEKLTRDQSGVVVSVFLKGYGVVYDQRTNTVTFHAPEDCGNPCTDATEVPVGVPG